MLKVKTPPPLPKRRNNRLALVLSLTVALLFLGLPFLYLVEDWRGRLAWRHLQAELTAKGEPLSWNSFIPSPVPANENFYAAPKMSEWFVNRNTNELEQLLSIESLERFSQRIRTNVFAELIPISLDAKNPEAKAPEGIKKEIAKILEDSMASSHREEVLTSQKIKLATVPLKPVKPLHFTLKTATKPTIEEMTRLFAGPLSLSNSQVAQLRVVPAGDRFQILLTGSPYTVDEYLAWSGQFGEQFEAIRKALKRPYARIEGNYSPPMTGPVPNPASIRLVTQIKAQRAQCFLLRRESQKAMEELSLLFEFARMFEDKPENKPMSLVSVMLNVAVVAVYVDVIADGLRRAAWTDEQLAIFEENFRRVSFAPLLAKSLRSERAAFLANVESMVTKSNTPPGTKLATASKFPRGWLCQNFVNYSILMQQLIDSVDRQNDAIIPTKADAVKETLAKDYRRFSPYKFLVSIGMPDFTPAIRTTTHNQTLLNQARIACALERYKLRNKRYPEFLAALVPEFLDKLPHDIVGGLPLKYSLASNGTFSLYSVGWNQTDDHGSTNMIANVKATPDWAKEDWVWR